MFYVYHKKAGTIVSSSLNKPPLKENETVGILEAELVLSREAQRGYRVRKGRLVEIDLVRRNRERVLRKERRLVQQQDAIHHFWETLESKDFNLEKARECLRTLAQTFPSMRKR